MPGLKNILSQFADDTSAYLNYDKTTLNEFCQVIECIENQTGLKVSYEKTKIFLIGSLVNSCAKLYMQITMDWSNEPIEMLGVTLNYNGEHNIKNFYNVLTKLRNVCANWYSRTLSLIGKVTVINTLMASLFVYKMTTLTNFSKENIEEADKIINDFLWNGKCARISKDILIRKY